MSRQVHLTTARGKRLVVDVDSDGKGRTFYAVARVGTFTIGPSRFRDADDVVHVEYGRVTGYSTGYHLADEHPVVNRVPLLGGAVFSPDRMYQDSPSGRGGWWLACRRPTSTYTAESVSEATRAATADIVRALVEHWQASPDYRLRIAEYVVDQGPRRVAEAHSTVERLETELDELREKIAAARADVEREQVVLRQAEEVVAGDVTAAA